MSGIETWNPDGTPAIVATDQLGLLAGYVEISQNSNRTGSVYNSVLMLGNPFFIYVSNTQYILAPIISINKSTGVLTWDGSRIPSYATPWAGTIHYGTY
jgi:hypothetical protein